MTYCGKKIFSDELYKFLNIKKQPYYLNYVYNSFFIKIENQKKWNSYQLNDEVKNLLNITYGNYLRASEIKKKIKEHHVISIQIPNEIKCLKSNNVGILVQEICI